MDTLPSLPVTITIGGTIISIGLLHLFYIIGLLVFHVCLALATKKDAARMNTHNGRGTFLVGENLWALAVLLFGLFGVCAYWLIHHSTLRPTSGVAPTSVR